MAIPAYSFAGVLLSSCGKSDIDKLKTGKKIGIIGAGISGLHAAWMLQKEGYDVEILEASDKVGGRIQSIGNLLNMGSSELGAAKVYGQNNDWNQIVRSQATLQNSSQNSSTYFIDGQEYSQTMMSSSTDYQSMDQRLKQLSGVNSGSDMTVENYMETMQVPERVQFIFKSKTEQFLGTSIDRASVVLNSLEGLEKINQEEYQSNISFEEVLMRQYGTIYPTIVNNTQVISIDYSGDKIKVVDALQVERVYDQVIVTVPLSILKIKSSQAYGIAFKPSLPESKIKAMDMLGMDSSLKIFLKVNKKFWSSESSSIYVNSKIGKFEILKSNASSGQYLLSATIHGENADILNNMSETEIIDLIKEEWKEQINETASKSIIEHKVIFWGKEKFIQGSFSYHKVGSHAETRTELFRPIEDRLYFAGEACNTKNNSGTIHGAIETAKEVVKSISKKQA
ncbi:MAG: FAD-dependent oxidoreductase [Bacteroidia bacterium]|nr:FAD-dependent oxidoreductase [Bacteroidia bacterium]